MEIVIGKSNGLRAKIARNAAPKIKEFLQLHGLKDEGDLEKNCIKVAKQYEILRKDFNDKKQQGLTPKKFENFSNTPQYEEMFERELDNYEADLGFSGWESDFSDFKNLHEGLGVRFENFSVKKLLGGAKDAVSGAVTKIVQSAPVQLIKDDAKFKVAPLKKLLTGQDTEYETGIFQKIADPIQKKMGQVLGGMLPLQQGGGLVEIPTEQLPIYSDAPLDSVRDNVVAYGARSWLNSDREKAVDELLKNAEEERERAKIKAELVRIGVDPRRFTNFVGEDFDTKKAKQAINDLLTGVVEGEKAKAQMDAMPKIIILGVIMAIVGFLLAKYA